MNQQNMLAKAIMIASTACCESSQMDKGGKAYILHPIYVMNTVKSSDPEVLQMAVLHDLLEDHDNWSPQRLRDEDFSERVIIGLTLLRHNKQDTYSEYIDKVATTRDTILVKMADLRHNSLITRLQDRASQKDGERTVKYQKCYIFLKEQLLLMKTPDQQRIAELEKRVIELEEAEDQRFIDDIIEAERESL